MNVTARRLDSVSIAVAIVSLILSFWSFIYMLFYYTFDAIRCHN